VTIADYEQFQDEINQSTFDKLKLKCSFFIYSESNNDSTTVNTDETSRSANGAKQQARTLTL